MDYHSLIGNVLGKMKKCRDTFSNTNDVDSKKKAYGDFVDGISSVNKILKGGAFGESAKQKIKEILKTSITQAGEMKAQMKNMSGGGNSGRGTNMSNNSKLNWFLYVMYTIAIYYVI